MTGDDREHHVNDLPYNTPVRTGLGVAWIMTYLIMALGATNDLIAIALQLSINDLTWLFRVAFFVVPPLAFFITKRLCLSIQRQKREKALHGEETSRVVRTETGEMLEIHAPLSDYDRWVLVQHDDYRPLAAGKGVSSLRAKASSFFFKDRIEPVTPAELRAALEHMRPREARHRRGHRRGLPHPGGEGRALSCTESSIAPRRTGRAPRESFPRGPSDRVWHPGGLLAPGAACPCDPPERVPLPRTRQRRRKLRHDPGRGKPHGPQAIPRCLRSVCDRSVCDRWQRAATGGGIPACRSLDEIPRGHPAQAAIGASQSAQRA